MTQPLVAVTSYKKPYVSVWQAMEQSNALLSISTQSRVFIKPNIVFWTRAVDFPKWGMITTSRVMADMIRLLKEHGVADITVGEGTVVMNPKDTRTQTHAYRSLGYDTLAKRYDIDIINVLERPFQSITLGDDVTLNFNVDALESDVIVDLPVLKTHNQTVVSLGIKNLKGLLDIPSRKKCHSADPMKNLHYMVARMADGLPPVVTLIDGIYSLEKGPAFDGRVRRSDVLIASTDIIAADMVGASYLGFDPAVIPHLAYAARNHNRSLDLNGISIVGDGTDKASLPYPYAFEWGENDWQEPLPFPLVKIGIKGLSYPKYDSSLCTYCAYLNGLILTAIHKAWKGKPWKKVEILTGKIMSPSQGKSKTVLLGKCMCRLNGKHPHINHAIPVKSCPPQIPQIIDALHQAGIAVDRGLFDHHDQIPGVYMHKYDKRPEFDPSFFEIKDN